MPRPRHAAQRRAAPDAGDLGVRHRFQPPGAHHGAVRLGDPELHAVAQGQSVQQALGALVRDRVAERLVGHRAHRAHVGLVRDGAQGDPLGQVDVDRQQPRLAQHDRLRLLRLEAGRDQGLVQPRRVVVAARLPLHPGHLGVRGEVGDRGGDEVADAGLVRPVEVAVGDEAAAPGEGHQPERAVLGDRERAGRLGVGAQLFVVGGQEGCGVGHVVTVSCLGSGATHFGRRVQETRRARARHPRRVASSRQRAPLLLAARSPAAVPRPAARRAASGNGSSVGNWIEPFAVT